jgi:hypothetical protein
MFKYIHGTTFFNIIEKYLEIGDRKYIEICGTSYLNLENI